MGRKRHLKGNRPPPDRNAEARTKALKALKEYQKKGSFRDNYSEVVEVIIDESDRGAVILMGSIIEDVLGDRIIKAMPNGVACREELLRQGGLLQSFQAKMTMGLALGLIDEDLVDSLDIIRQLRNACAHSMLEATLFIPAFKDVFLLMIGGDAAKEVKATTNSEYMRLALCFVMVFHLERILGADVVKAQAAVTRMADTARRIIAEETVKLATSRGIQSE